MKLKSSFFDNENGTVLILLSIVVIAVLALSGLAIDGWRGLIAARQAQGIADIVVTAGVNQLRIPNCNNCYLQSSERWSKIKKATLAALAPNILAVFDTTAKESLLQQSLRYNSGLQTYDDTSGYNRDTASAGNIELTVTRGVACYVNDSSGAPMRLWFSLENKPASWCRANSVRATLTIKDIPTSFANVIGFRYISTIKVSAGAERNVPFTCGEDRCSTLGTVNQAANSFEPFPCIV